MQKPPKNATKHSITDAQTNRRTDQPTKRIIESYTRNLRQTLVCDIRRKVIVDENKWISFFFLCKNLQLGNKIDMRISSDLLFSFVCF